MRILLAAVVMTVACGGGQIANLPLTWRGVDHAPRPSEPVAQGFAATPLAFQLRDSRPDASAVGTYEDSGYIVRTSDNVAQYCAARLGELLRGAGARLDGPSLAALDAELLEYKVVEGGTFSGIVTIRAIVHRGAGEAWSKIYTGKSRRWGRSHSPDNFNEALSNALADAATQLVQDEAFARVLVAANPAALDPAPPGG